MSFFMEMITMISDYNEGGPPLNIKYSVIDAAKNKYCPCKEYQTRDTKVQDNLYSVIERSVRTHTQKEITLGSGYRKGAFRISYSVAL